MESWRGLEEQYIRKILWLLAPVVLPLKYTSLHQAQHHSLIANSNCYAVNVTVSNKTKQHNQPP